MNTEDCPFTYVKLESVASMDLNEIYIKEQGKEHLGVGGICQMCMQVVTCVVTAIEEIDVDTLRRYIPQIDFSSTKQLALCKVCLDSLDTHKSLLKKLVSVKEECNATYDDEAAGVSSIKQEEIEIKSENHSDVMLWNVKNEPVDCTVEYKSDDVTTNSATVEDIRERHGPKDKYDDIKHSMSSVKRVYRCYSCNYMAVQKSNLKRHVLIHRNVPEEDMYQCDSCSFKTKRRDSFIKHKLIHKDIPEEQMYKCDLCSYKTIQRAYLTRHLRRHVHGSSKERMYQCDLCDYKTERGYAMTQHQQRHTDFPEEQMYKCDTCDYKTFKSALVQHKLKHKDISRKANVQA